MHIVTTPTTTQHNLNTVVGLNMKMTLHTTPPTTDTQYQMTIRVTSTPQPHPEFLLDNPATPLE